MKTWNTSGIEGVNRFLGRTWRLIVGSPLTDGTFLDGTVVTDEEPTLEQLRSLHKCIAKVIGNYLFSLPLHCLFMILLDPAFSVSGFLECKICLYLQMVSLLERLFQVTCSLKTETLAYVLDIELNTPI